ncbi:DUF6438 domain-containing protein [Flavobacterium procerum]|uniref:DUF6438 domain-containing protein n=1 Tax=Flavobacterium procerum TaxID=1455569 RepID=A0ABV6BKZ5_9FLAO
MKSKKMLPLLSLFLVLFSCTTKNEEFKKNILGEWKFIKFVDTKTAVSNNGKLLRLPAQPSFELSTQGYVFSEKDSCEVKMGYFKRVDSEEWEKRRTFYLGNKTKYEIKDDSLKILNLSTKKWVKQKIYSISEDTLTFQFSDSTFAKFAKIRYKPDPKESYDHIMVSSSGCYGICPIMDIRLDKNGDVLYYGNRYNTQNGIFKSKISVAQYKSIENSFKKADLKNLKNAYSADISDQEEVTITFVKDNKIVKSISDYGREAPMEFTWAYTPVRFLYQQLKLKPEKFETPLLSLSGFSFTKGKMELYLTKSESFYLLTELQKPKTSNSTFENEYKIEFWNDKNKKEVIFTDGRFYKIKGITFDLGYNLLIENNLESKFTKSPN